MFFFFFGFVVVVVVFVVVVCEFFGVFLGRVGVGLVIDVLPWYKPWYSDFFI